MRNYVHDCDHCKFVGAAILNMGSSRGERVADLYVCAGDDGFTAYIARLSDEGSDYISGLSDTYIKRRLVRMIPHQLELPL